MTAGHAPPEHNSWILIRKGSRPVMALRVICCGCMQAVAIGAKRTLTKIYEHPLAAFVSIRDSCKGLPRKRGEVKKYRPVFGHALANLPIRPPFPAAAKCG